MAHPLSHCARSHTRRSRAAPATMCHVSAEGSVEGVDGAPIRDKAAWPRITERAGLTPRTSDPLG
eukprot:5580365-Prymnesium_polylepis.1